MHKAVLITGVLGGIGKAMALLFKEEGYYVIGLDSRNAISAYCDSYYHFDINRFCTDVEYRDLMTGKLNAEIPTLHILINNAAVQILAEIDELELSGWNHTLNVNLTGPMLLTKLFLSRLEVSGGSVINIGSIHQQLTKRRFIAYATSKSALVGFTKALSVDLQGRVRVNCISPAAIDTPMLREGFNNDDEKVQKLSSIHPLQRIGKPEEVARMAYLLAEGELGFINGANIQMDGGIANVLHDIEP